MIEIEKPTIECIYSNEDPNYGKFIVEPLERGYGTTSRILNYTRSEGRCY